MKYNQISRLFILIILLVMIGTSFTRISFSKTVPSMELISGGIISGQILFCPLYGETTYLIDNTGAINHTWPSIYSPGCTTYWLGNNTIIRTIRDTPIYEGGAGGGIQKMLSDGTVTWDFRYNTNGNVSHHDIKILPNGNILMIAWKIKTDTEAIAAGRNPDTIYQDTFMPDHIIEVKPTGPTSGDIVWEWNAWDHLIQDFNSSKANYGIVGNHPELIDINYGTFFTTTDDWLHTNSIDYNPQFDQILLSVHNFNEIWVIDHSTTTEEAAGHSGGNSGKGGDLLYRWGNPAAYRRGTSDDQMLFGQHDASWIQPEFPGDGHMLIFNNGLDRSSGEYSSVDEINPPVDVQGHYYLEPGSSYGPENLTWVYKANPPSSFFAYYCSSAERLKDGDTLICDGVSGKFFEVTSDGTTVWQWTNNYPYPSINDVFEIVYIPPCELPPQNITSDLDCQGSLSSTNIKPGGTVHGFFEVENIGDVNSMLNWTVNSYPSWGTWSFTPMSGQGLTPELGAITVQVNVTTPNQKNTEFQGYIRVVNVNNQSDFCLIPVYVKTPLNQSLYFYQFYEKFFQRFTNVFMILLQLFGY